MDVTGGALPPGYTWTLPLEVSPVIVTLTETAWALDGTPHEPVRMKVRTPPAASAGASPMRVSIARHGVTVKKLPQVALMLTVADPVARQLAAF